MLRKIFTIIFFIAVMQVKATPNPFSYGKYIAMPISIQEERWVDSIMNTLTPTDRIAQLFMVAAYSNLGDSHVQSIKDGIQKHKIGGLIFFQGTVAKQVSLTNTYQSLSKLPLLISMDAEWGLNMRLKEVISYPRQMTLGAIQNDEIIYNLGAEFARQCKLMGVHISFSPSVDVNNNANNPVINTRSFGENPYNVARKGSALMEGMQDNGVMACAKHFPGHGDTDTDSHHALPEISHDMKRLDSLELLPFREIIRRGITMVMVGHLNVPTLEPIKERPSSISKAIINDFLVDNMEFEGLVISDALNMKGVKDNANGKNITVEALKAGQDILLMPDAIGPNITAIEEAIKTGELTQKYIDDKCRKVLTAKYRVGLNKWKKIDENGVLAKLNSEYAELLNAKLMESAITLVSNNDNLLPFHALEKRIGYLAIGKSTKTFSETLSLYTNIIEASVSKTPTQAEIVAAKSALAECDIIIVGYHSLDSRPNKDFGVDSKALAFIEELAADKDKQVVLTAFGSPYSLTKIDKPQLFESIIVAYDDNKLSQEKTAQMIFGGLPFMGQLPVSAGSFKEGTGIETSVTRLSYVTPNEIGIDKNRMKRVDSLINVAVNQRATPGCQVLAAYRGKVFYNKSFGRQTFDPKSEAVKTTDIYDLASVTKTTATLPIIMGMVDKEYLDLDGTLKQYVDLSAKSNKSNLKIRDILLHQSGLLAWIPFHLSYLEVAGGANVFGKKSETYSINVPGTRRYMHKNFRLDPKYFSKTKGNDFKNPVATGVYGNEALKKDIFLQMDTSKLDAKKYRYSDFGFIYMQRVIEKYYKQQEKDVASALFFRPLGMSNTSFVPLNKFSASRIIPTENDKIFRRQQIKGYVHDQTASMLGGNAGHAGLFANANDLAKMYQMLLNKGTYGGHTYISEATVNLFTSYGSENSRRGLGFDKQEPDKKKISPICEEASLSSFGHTGFTGTMVWVDPERELVFVFLSNRVYPEAENKRLFRLNTRSEAFAEFTRAIDDLQKPSE